MQTIKSFLDQSLLIWKVSTAAARFGIILLLAICVGAIVGVGIWSSQPEYVILADRLDNSKLSQLIAALDQANIEYQIKGAGTIIQVDQRNFDRASVAAGILGIGSHEPDLETASPWMDPLNQQNVLRRNLERQLASSIQRNHAIESATVHLGIPEKQPFLRQSNQPTASVVLSIAKGKRIDEEQARTIASTVAKAVPGLQPDQVVITDTDLNNYSMDETQGRLTKQEEYRLLRERELSDKADAILVKILGFGNSNVGVTANFSFPDEKLVSTEHDPSKKVLTSEKVDSSTTTDENATPAGAAGVANNIGNAGKSSNGKIVTTKTEVLDSTYEVSSVVREELVRTPVLNSVGISILANSKKLQNANKEIPDEIKKSIELSVKRAVGFREGVDEFSLEFVEFAEIIDVTEVPVAAFPWEQINSILKNVSLGIAALVALFLGLKAIKNLQSAPIAIGPAAQLTGDRASQVGQLSEMVKQNPEVFSKIIAAWANDADGKSGEQKQERAA